MSKNSVSPAEFFGSDRQEAYLALIACPGAEELTQQVDNHLVKWANEAGIMKDTFIVPSDCPRFQSGDAKGLVKVITIQRCDDSVAISIHDRYTDHRKSVICRRHHSTDLYQGLCEGSAATENR